MDHRLPWFRSPRLRTRFPIPTPARLGDWSADRTAATVAPVKRARSSPGLSITSLQAGKQLAIFLENKPGTLARVCDALAEAGINIYAFTTSDTVDHAVVRMVVSDYRRALHLFEERGTLVVEDDVLLVEGRNQPGSLAAIAHALADAGINIEYAYCSSAPGQQRGLLVLRVRDVPKAMKVLNLQSGSGSGPASPSRA